MICSALSALRMIRGALSPLMPRRLDRAGSHDPLTSSQQFIDHRRVLMSRAAHRHRLGFRDRRLNELWGGEVLFAVEFPAGVLRMNKEHGKIAPVLEAQRLW